MFEKFRLNQKLKAFRKNSVTCEQYNKEDQVLTLKSGDRTVNLAFDVITYDGKRQLAFSGDVISSDGEALSRVMKAMWNEELPAKFFEDEELIKQLWGDEAIPAPSEETIPDAASEHEGEEPSEPDEESNEAQPPRPIYFRDMASYVTGMPNEVIVTIKASYRIDNE